MGNIAGVDVFLRKNMAERTSRRVSVEERGFERDGGQVCRFCDRVANKKWFQNLAKSAHTKVVHKAVAA
jgi:hypothetical protein